MTADKIIIYTDGSCNADYFIGGWASILFIGDEKIVLSGFVTQTTHQRMELYAVIKSFEHLVNINLCNLPVLLYTDSQYVLDLPKRSVKWKASGFITNRSLPIRNVELVRELVDYFATIQLTIFKVKAHHWSGDENSNREVDKLSRSIVRDRVNELLNKANITVA